MTIESILTNLNGSQRTALRSEVRARLAERRLARYRPYPKQLEFHHAQDAQGRLAAERLLMAGNQLGKTLAGAAEGAMHATGRYPDWWQGRRLARGSAAWVAGVTGNSTRDNPQRMLLGRPGAYGTGMLPASDIVSVRASTGVADAVDNVRVTHRAGGESVIYFKTYEQGRERWQGESLDWIWFDEEPPPDIYSEGLTRLTATGGFAFITFTPLLGQSSVVTRFLQERPPGSVVISMTIDDALHYTVAERAEIIARWPAHERDARARGIPYMGSGRVFPLDEAAITCPAFPIPAHWPRIVGLDFGWDHPTAAAWLAWDRDTDTVYVTDCYRQNESTPVVHAAAIKARGAWIPVAWPHDGLNDTAAGPQLARQYRELGVAMRLENAKLPLDPRAPERSRISVEAGVLEIFQRMQTGRWKVFSHLAQWLEEYRLYHREDGKIVPKADDLLSASRYGYMDLRFAVVAQARRPAVAYEAPLDREMGY